MSDWRKTLKVGVFGTVYFAALGWIYVTVVGQLPQSFPGHITASTPPTSPEVAVPSLILFGLATLVAIDAHGHDLSSSGGRNGSQAGGNDG